jgi:hypothetical protein
LSVVPRVIVRHTVDFVTTTCQRKRAMTFSSSLPRAGVRQMAAAMLVVVVAAAGCGARAGRMASVAVADAQTAVRVKTALVNDAVLGTLPIDVRAEAGVVTLRGTVNAAAEVDRALALARGVAGVSRVESALSVREPGPLLDADSARDARDAGRSPSDRQRLPALAPRPEAGPLRIVGLGGSLRLTRPSENVLGRTLVVGPLLRLRPRNGLGPTVAFNWTNTAIETGPGGRPGLAKIRLRPVMGGVELGTVRGRFWAGASVVAGYSFNRLRVDATRVGSGRAIDVGHSFVWRPGAAVWIDVTPRLGINVFGGYLFTSPTVTFAGDTSIATERVGADSAVVSVGVAYWIF